MLPQIEIEPQHWEIVRTILHTHIPHYEVWAFGSRARRQAQRFSDLDLAIITTTPLPLRVYATLVEDFIDSDLPWRVDVLDWASITPAFQAIIVQDHVVVQQGGN
ncbi:nucleotidyltransferase family protein [Candidatus Oscillochloris fontis]|uniref:nucleotidyltransferase family protein n=1 Tax=Candidatus Oscillochloris fontis TaxID=2496868 RepID=UPI00101DD8BD|nr:nucleotidyltransferase domain-containing protein [Candidatus Oscillochloris fontis]